MLQQLQYNANLSSYLGFFIGNFVAPIVFFVGAYLLNPRKLTLVGRLFESLLLLLVGQTILQVVVEIALMQFTGPVTDPYWGIIVRDIAATTITAAAYFGTLVYLRATKRWK